MNRRTWIAVVVALGACRSGKQQPPPGAAGSGSGGSAAVIAQTAPPTQGSADPWAKSSDPWDVKPPQSDAPTFGERHKLAELACPKVTGPYFFEIEKDGKTSYILGTRHISVPLSKFPPVVTDKLHHAKLAVFEVAPDDDSHEKSKDLDLPAAIGPELWGHYRALIGAAEADTLEHASPGTAVISMMVLYEDVSAFLDKQIQDEVAQMHIPARGLETAAFQDGVLEDLLDVRMLKATIKSTKDRAELQEHSQKDLHDYCAGTDDSPGMDADDRKDMIDAGYTADELDAMDEKLVFQRNARWIPQLEKLFATGDVFVAVGADHLTGKRGVISLLEARGFHTRRITE
jgi:uncharacterized protein YbaP (TraB family)